MSASNVLGIFWRLYMTFFSSDNNNNNNTFMEKGKFCGT